jgi:6-phosphogluconolactonase
MAAIQVFPDKSALSAEAVVRFVSLAQQSILKRGSFSVALSGGSTPKALYEELGAPEQQNRLKWHKIHLFFGDERNVPPDEPGSNFRMVQEALLSKVSVPEANIHRVKAELDAKLAAFSYEEELRAFFDGPWPRFDLILLGMGEDGHTASLFPKTAGLNEEQRWFIPNHVPQQNAWRLTLTKNAINAARAIIVLVQGKSKADMLAEVLPEGLAEEVVNDPTRDLKPIQLIAPTDGEMIWLLDQEAASQLPSGLSEKINPQRHS